ncbi:hypothetical protein [Bacillus cereus group sp. MYBK48-1]|uniref:hypothetical protein n=1 Tax=Bacillus cereus group sp. MYBK48-1 TaxID=3450624 RepID=UPI003F7B0189
MVVVKHQISNVTELKTGYSIVGHTEDDKHCLWTVETDFQINIVNLSCPRKDEKFLGDLQAYLKTEEHSITSRYYQLVRKTLIEKQKEKEEDDE